MQKLFEYAKRKLEKSSTFHKYVLNNLNDYLLGVEIFVNNKWGFQSLLWESIIFKAKAQNFMKQMAMNVIFQYLWTPYSK